MPDVVIVGAGTAGIPAAIEAADSGARVVLVEKQSRVGGMLHVLAIADGQLETALALITRYVERADESGAPMTGRQVGVLMLLAPALYLGRADILLAGIDEPGGPASLTRPGRPAAFFLDLVAARAMCLAQLGRMQEARTLVGPLLDDVDGSVDYGLPIEAPVVLLLQAAVVLEHQAAAGALAARLADVAQLTGYHNVCMCVARHLGDAAALIGDYTAARAYYAQALDAAGKIRFRPELALTHVSVAELLVKEADDAARSDALEHLELAIPELRDMKMQPGLERALALRENVAPSLAKAPPRGSPSDVLTAREREIATLVADGLSNRDIAEKLVISEGTVDVHVKHILGKLGFRSRAQVAGWVARQGSA
jgi:ATP/maltotriose-dependent transcriptional regulator MalT